MTQLKKRLQKLEKAQLKNDPIQLAKNMLSGSDLDLLEELGYDRAAFDEAHLVVWFRWESALEAAKAGQEYPIPVLSEVYARL